MVNDTPDYMLLGVVDATMRWPGGERRWRFGGPIGADEVVKVGRVDVELTDCDEDGKLEYTLSLTAGDVTSVNGYASRVVAALPT